MSTGIYTVGFYRKLHEKDPEHSVTLWEWRLPFMKKLFGLLCVAAVIGAVYVGIIAPGQGKEVTIETIEAEAEEFADHAQDLYEEYGEEVVEQANEAINEAVESAVEGAADNFWESLKQSGGAMILE